MEINQKHLDFMCSSKKVIEFWPDEVRRAVYHALGQLQNSIIPSNTKSMKFVGHGAYEIRIMHKYRVIYHAGKATVTVLTAFSKSSYSTPKHHLKAARKALCAAVNRIVE